MPGIDTAQLDRSIEASEPAADVIAGLIAGLDCLRVGVALFDRTDRLVYCNEHFRYIYRSFSNVSELVGLSFIELMSVQALNNEIAGDMAASDPQGWIARRSKERRKSYWESIEQRLADGRWIEIKERPVDGVGIIGIWTDITQQKIAQLTIVNAVSKN